MEHNPNTIHPVVKTFSEYMPKPFIDEVSPTLTYVGWAHLGVDEDKPLWLIEKIEKIGTITKVTYPCGSMKFNQKWSNRLTLKYSR